MELVVSLSNHKPGRGTLPPLKKGAIFAVLAAFFNCLSIKAFGFDSLQTITPLKFLHYYRNKADFGIEKFVRTKRVAE